MSTKTYMARTILDAVKATFENSAAGIVTSGGESIAFYLAQNTPDVKRLIRAVQNMPGCALRVLRADPGDRRVTQCAIMRYTLAADVFMYSGNDLAGNLDIWDLLDRMMIVVGQEQAKVGGSTGAGGLFGDAALTAADRFDRIERVFYEGPQEVQSVDAEANGGADGLQWGHYEFGVEVRRDVGGLV